MRKLNWLVCLSMSILGLNLLGAAHSVEEAQEIFAKQTITKEDVENLHNNYADFQQAFVDRLTQELSNQFSVNNEKEKVAAFLAIHCVDLSDALVAAGHAAMNAARRAVVKAAWSAVVNATGSTAGNAARKAATMVLDKVALSDMGYHLEELGQRAWSISSLAALNWLLTGEARALIQQAYDAVLLLVPENVKLDTIKKLESGAFADNPFIEMITGVALGAGRSLKDTRK